MRATIGRLFLRLWGWRLVGALPPTSRFVFIAAPHTSHWDLPFMLATAWALNVPIDWFAKHEFFSGPLGWLLRSLGGMPVDRRAPHGLVQQAVTLFADRDRLRLGIAPEGTRSRRDFWKSGFYHIARGAGVPVATGFLDYSTRRCGLGPLIEFSGDIAADMDAVRAFYGSLQGKHPELQGPIRLREEAPSGA